MILTVTANPALDVTYRTTALRPGESHRVGIVGRSAGGKGVNVARVLRALGEDPVCVGFLGGSTGAEIRELLDRAGIRHEFLPVQGPTRTTVTVVDDSGATVLNEPGPQVSAADWRSLADVVATLMSPGDVLVISGSTPPGTPPDAVASLVRDAVEMDVRVVVDTSGPTLLAAADAGADVLKPNAEELRAATQVTDVRAAAGALLDRGAGLVVVSLGEAGVVAVGDVEGVRQIWTAAPPEVLTGNPTGAGDAAVAAISLALGSNHRPDGDAVSSVAPRLHDVVALSGAAVMAPVAGDFDVPTYQRLLARTDVKETHATR
ncbi:1-phosphofructokinase family hexose kinase [Occultella glacieicola]|uniref:1-phosphofructokinase family hexose kinase n=1 Tax=Occultella glacieicola TaxID=2518684 RepID=A0ABY2E322_9MICO|nr:1-phosphofructokinase family hexose kinase [Occultella glacieicola]TDE92555.1 1-phosphofructokinase family hexose kinase [Occultella glacieicola]